MKPSTWDRLMTSLVLIRLGQELGGESKVARAIHFFIDILIGVMK